MSPSTVSENGVVGQATSFDLTLDGKTPYTYTQTFGNICTVDINDNIATVTITPTEIGILTGSITFNEEATCSITIDVQAEPTGYSLTPTTVIDSIPGGYTGTYTLTLDVGSDFDSAELYVDSTAFGTALLSKYTMSSAGTITLSYHADEYSESEDMTDVFTVTATCHRKDGLPDIELSSTFNITVTEPEPTPPVITVTPNTVSENGVVGQATSFDLTLSGDSTYTYTQTFGNICSVDINDNIATVTITPTEIGILTGSITFNEEATCNITIDVQAEPTGYSLTPTTVNDKLVDSKKYTLTLSVGSDFDYAYIDYNGNQYGDVTLSTVEMSSAGTITVTYNGTEYSETEDITDVFTVTARCYRKDGLSPIVLTSTFTIQQYE